MVCIGRTGCWRVRIKTLPSSRSKKIMGVIMWTPMIAPTQHSLTIPPSNISILLPIHPIIGWSRCFVQVRRLRGHGQIRANWWIQMIRPPITMIINAAQLQTSIKSHLQAWFSVRSGKCTKCCILVWNKDKILHIEWIHPYKLLVQNCYNAYYLSFSACLKVISIIWVRKNFYLWFKVTSTSIKFINTM